MGRKSALTPEQWIEIERRHVINGESVNSLAKEFKVNEAAIRRKINPNKSERNPLRVLAQKKVLADKAIVDISEQISELPYAKQKIVSDLAAKLSSISIHLGSAAEYGAMTSHRLSGIANSQVDKIDDADPMKSDEALKAIAVLTKIANSSAEIGLNLLRANKEAVDGMNKASEAKPEPKQIVFNVTDASA